MNRSSTRGRWTPTPCRPKRLEGESLEQVEIASTIDYLLVPVDSYLDVEGVRAATRVAPSDVYIAGVAGGQEQATFLGVDRTQLASVIGESWDPTFAGEPLGAMLNRLAADPSAALVSKEYMLENDVKIGDRVDLRLNDRGETITVPFRVAGSLDYFPTLYPESGPFVIGNLDYSIEQQGGPYPFQIWLKMKSGSNLEGVQGEAYGQSLAIMEGTPRELINADMARPERQGLLGLLTVGFLGAAIVTVVGYLAHTIVSFRRRLVEMGILRAMGLSNRQLASLLIWEQVLVVGSGGLFGAGLGVLASRMFVPFLRVRSGEHPNTPPFVVEIAWDQIAMICAVTGGMLVLTVGIILLLLRSMRIFEAVKLGETV
ncbi:MAG: ABC transporter permease [Chloroflexia bacterium]